MRIVSLVPSWTETLLLAGVDVVGRTRYCIHPAEQVSKIPRVGGTKDWHFERILALKPDLLVLDQEENPKFMGEQTKIPFLATHIQQVSDVAPALEQLHGVLKRPALAKWAEEWRQVIAQFPKSAPERLLEDTRLLRWGRRPNVPIQNLLYVIWKNPWMVVGRNTFVGSMLDLVGFGPYMQNLRNGHSEEHQAKYPTVDLSQYNPQTTLLLFASEPYPFLRHEAEVEALGFPYAFVDGENWSWFGNRALLFLQSRVSP